MLLTLKKSIAAGMMIGIGSTIYLASENKVIGAVLFSIGLFLICSFQMYLFTGKIGYVISTKNKPNCAIIWLGNFIGSIVVSIAVRVSKPAIHTTAVEVVTKKVDQNLLSVILLSLLCGILMYLAVDNFAKRPHSISGIAGIVLCVSVFILCGFEHSIANMNYCALAIQSWNDVLPYSAFLVIVSIANGIGALAIRQLIKEE